MSAGNSALDAVMTMAVGVLKGDSTFTGLVTGGIFDVIPQGTSYPCCRILTRESSSPLETFGQLGFTVEQRVRSFTDASAMGDNTATLDAIVKRAVQLLHNVVPTLSGWVVGLIHYVQTLAPVETFLDGKRVIQKDVVFEWSVWATS